MRFIETEIGANYKVLRKADLIKFDPLNHNHMLKFASFTKYSNWKDGCPFELEKPYLDIPSMIKDKIARHIIANFIGKV